MPAPGREQECSRDLPLDVDLLGPIGVLCGTQPVPQIRELCDVRFCRVRMPMRASAERACEMRDRLDMAKGNRRTCNSDAPFQSLRSTMKRAGDAASA